LATGSASIVERGLATDIAAAGLAVGTAARGRSGSATGIPARDDAGFAAAAAGTGGAGFAPGCVSFRGRGRASARSCSVRVTSASMTWVAAGGGEMPARDRRSVAMNAARFLARSTSGSVRWVSLRVPGMSPSPGEWD
jgi:hypothetical protein